VSEVGYIDNKWDLPITTGLYRLINWLYRADSLQLIKVNYH